MGNNVVAGFTMEGAALGASAEAGPATPTTVMAAASRRADPSFFIWFLQVANGNIVIMAESWVKYEAFGGAITNS